jgi:Glycosyl hydrolase family 76
MSMPEARVTPETCAERAVAAYAAMQQWFAVADGSSLYRETSAPTQERPYAYLWPYSWALVATVDLAGVPPHLLNGLDPEAAIPDRLSGLARYWDGRRKAYASYVMPPLGPGGDLFFDDNAWVGLALVQLHRMRGEFTLDADSGLLGRIRKALGSSRRTLALTRARQLHAFALAKWGTCNRGTVEGGLPWVDAEWNRDRGTGANAGHAELGAQLAELTGDDELVGSSDTLGAVRLFEWVTTNLRDPGDGLYWDKFLGDGQLDRTKWSYNQAVMLGASALLYRCTGDERYRDRGVEIADAVLEHVDLTHQPASFNCMLCRNLLLLASVTGNDAYPRLMEAYSEWTWTTVRDAETTLFPFDGKDRPVTLLDQAAMIQINALLAWDPADWSKLA